MAAHLYPSDEAGRDFIMRGFEGPVMMLNLLKLRDVADYADYPELAGDGPISGRAAYARYIDHTIPFLKESGGQIDLIADGGKWLIGPADESWDLVLLIHQSSVATFLAFENNPDYMKGIGHRQTAIADSRLLPLSAQTA